MEKIPYTDLKPKIIYKKKMAKTLELMHRNKLFKVTQCIGIRDTKKMSRKEVVMTRLRIGHTHFTHIY